jgi:hypothetical protein
MTVISYRRHRFPPSIIQHAIWLYLVVLIGLLAHSRFCSTQPKASSTRLRAYADKRIAVRSQVRR